MDSSASCWLFVVQQTLNLMNQMNQSDWNSLTRCLKELIDDVWHAVPFISNQSCLYLMCEDVNHAMGWIVVYFISILVLFCFLIKNNCIFFCLNWNIYLFHRHIYSFIVRWEMLKYTKFPNHSEKLRFEQKKLR